MAQEPSRVDDGSYFHSLDSEIFWLDKPGDTTVRPCRPSLLPFMTALRARILEAEAAQAQKAQGDSKQA
jgi:hypothetical protein